MDESRTNSKIPFRKSDLSLIIFLIIALLLVNAVLNLLFGQSYKKYAKFNINNISTFVWNNGEMDKSDLNKGGFYFPQNSLKINVFGSGIVFGGKVNNIIKINGNSTAVESFIFRDLGLKSALVPGRILKNKNPDDIYNTKNRVFRIRPDAKDRYKFYDFDEIELSSEEIMSQYEKDWNEWPSEYGAPFEDRNGNGIYEPFYDVPGIKGAHQTLWFVANDFDTSACLNFVGSYPIGMEIQFTVWGYNTPFELSNIIFKKYKLINKSDDVIKEFYFSIGSDPDIGYYKNDFSGCDTLLNLGFVYNGNDIDDEWGKHLSSVGCIFLDTKINSTKSNNLLTAFLGHYYKHPGWIESFEYGEGIPTLFCMSQGKIGTTGQNYVDPNSAVSTTFMFSGDPIEQTGWIDGQLHPSGERILFTSSGPYNLAPNDTLTLVTAELAALGKDRLESVRALKNYAKYLQEIYPEFEKNIHDNIVPVMPGLTRASEEYGAVNLSWDKESENYSANGYEFQGYNIYQFYNDFKINADPIRIAVFDKSDGVTRISGEKTEPTSGNRYIGLLQEGSDSGIKNKTQITKDYTTNLPLQEGKVYYFGLSAYYYNKEKNRAVESGINKFKITVNQEDNLEVPEKYSLLQN
ncbi:MAG: hypothetical protein F9K45_05005, partial [Melioribacteraceae bacterium]